MNIGNEAFTDVPALSCSDITDAIHCIVIEFLLGDVKTTEGNMFRPDKSPPLSKPIRLVFDAQKHPPPDLSDPP